MADQDDKKKKSNDDFSEFIPKNANIGVMGIAINGGVGMVGTSDSPIIGIATTGGGPSVDVGHDNAVDEEEQQD